jgi:peptidoglycan/xylan/chitin deacetylase (PgdA/CDA1 family)
MISGTDNGYPGVFILSLDTEGAWGTFDKGGLQRYAGHFDNIRLTVRRLLGLLDRYQIPATWAFVGHLLLDHCEKPPEGETHPEVLRPQYRWYPYDWHHLDPGTDVYRDPWWYGPDLLEMVLQAEVHHEIGTHTFSHIVVSDPDCTEGIFCSQLEACIEIHGRFGLKIDSIVYPRNAVAFPESLARLGVTVYRGVEDRWYAGCSPRLMKLAHILDRALALPPPTYALPSLVEGPLVNLPASMFYLPRDGFRRFIPIGSRVLQAKRGLARASQRGELFHLWFHPFNLASDPRLFSGLEEILRFASTLRSHGALVILTMCQAAERVRKDHQR